MAHPFKTILCPLDFDDNSMAALRTAANLTRDYNATLYLLHVVLGLSEKESDQLYAAERAEAENKLKAAAQQCLEGVAAHVISRAGLPAHVIVDEALKLNADLIVMATHGRKGLQHLILGSIAEHVIRNSPVPVMTIRPQKAATDD